MNLKELLTHLTDEQLDALANKTGTKAVYLKRCAYGYRKPSTELCFRLIENEKRLTLEDLRPDIWKTGFKAA